MFNSVKREVNDFFGKSILSIVAGNGRFGVRFSKVVKAKDPEFTQTRTKEWDACSISVSKKRLKNIHYSQAWWC